jgi:hypothetical protein
VVAGLHLGQIDRVVELPFDQHSAPVELRVAQRQRKGRRDQQRRRHHHLRSADAVTR